MWHLVQFFFVEFKRRTHANYPQLFSERNEETYVTSTSSFGAKWGWYSSMYSLAGEDITRFEQVEKLGINTCLTWLAFTKEKNELEKQQIKNARQK